MTLLATNDFKKKTSTVAPGYRYRERFRQRPVLHAYRMRNLDSIAKLIEGMSGSLQCEMADFRADMAQFRAEVNERFDGLETAIKRHDTGILAANMAANGITRAQAQLERRQGRS